MEINRTSEEILLCARTLLIANGYNGFSYADIAKVVGVRNSTIHHHFPTKARLVQTVLANYRQEAQAGLEALERQVPEAVGQLQAYVHYWESCIGDRSATFCLCALLAGELPVLPEEVALEVSAHFRALSAWLRSVLVRGDAQGTMELSSGAETEAQSFLATVHGAMLSARAYGEPEIFGVVLAPFMKRLIKKGASA